MKYVGRELFHQRPDVYPLTKFIFVTNKCLEKFAEEEHVQKFVVEEPWCHYDGVDIIHKHHAVKCTAEGIPLPYPGCTSWNGRHGDESGGRIFVAGGVACYFFWKVGWPTC